MLIVRSDGSPRRNVVPLRNVFEPATYGRRPAAPFTRDDDGESTCSVDHIDALIWTELGPGAAVGREPGAGGDTEDCPRSGLRRRPRRARGDRRRGDATSRRTRKRVGDPTGRSQPPPEAASGLRAVRTDPRTPWARPQINALREAGIPRPGNGVHVWRLRNYGETYEGAPS